MARDDLPPEASGDDLSGNAANWRFPPRDSREWSTIFQGLTKSLRARFQLQSADAEDIAMETMERAWDKQSMFRGNNKKTLKSWLFTIACRGDSIWADNKTQQRNLSDHPDATLQDPSLSFLSKCNCEDIHKAIDDLPPIQKTVLVLKAFEGNSYAEIAEIIGESVANTGKILERARERLRALLGQ